MLLAHSRTILCDLDGYPVSGETVLPGAGEFVASAGTRSNNSTDTAECLSRRLARGGLDLPPECIILAGVAALNVVTSRAPGARAAGIDFIHIGESAGARFRDLVELTA